MSHSAEKLDPNVFEVPQTPRGELKAACEHIVRSLIEGVDHGFFKMTIAVEKLQSNKTSVTVEAGKSTRFVF
jgi:hypothetical protein